MNKPKMVLVTGAELERLREDPADLALPQLVKQMGGYWADADELRAWRASTSTSEGNQS